MLGTQDLGKSYGARGMFEGVSLKCNPGGRYGLVGANGSDKTTFLNILAGDEAASAGVVSLAKSARVGVLRHVGPNGLGESTLLKILVAQLAADTVKAHPVHRFASFGCILGAALLGGCGSTHEGWALGRPQRHPSVTDDGWRSAEAAVAEDIPLVTTDPKRLPPVRLPSDRDDADWFRNTYYDFPRDDGPDRSATLFDVACTPLAKVSAPFHDQVCVQGSGQLASGETVSFAKRDCPCAALCPRTGQRICFERLDPRRFPHGRGASGGPIAPLHTVAVDPRVIPLGTLVFIPELVGLPRPEGGLHNGCFVAEDRGLRVVGRHIDIFTGDPAVTAQWNQRFPSNRGVHVRLADPHCRAH